MAAGGTRKGVREERIRITAEEVLNRGSYHARIMLMRRWKIKKRTWDEYLTEANSMIREAVTEDICEMKTRLTRRLEKLYATASKTVKVQITRELAKLHGCRAPVQVLQTNLDPSVHQLPVAVQAILDEPDRLAAELIKDERHLGDDGTVGDAAVDA